MDVRVYDCCKNRQNVAIVIGSSVFKPPTMGHKFLVLWSFYLIIPWVLSAQPAAVLLNDSSLLLEWHLPFSCAHHGFVCEMLGYLPQLQHLLGENRVIVSGLGICSDETLDQFAPKERQALEKALILSKKSVNQRFCRVTSTSNGFEQICESDTIRDQATDHNHEEFQQNRPVYHEEKENNNLQRIVVTHGDPCALRGHNSFKGAVAVIGRTMTEGKLSNRQIECLKESNLNELWLPSPWQVSIFHEDGVGKKIEQPLIEAHNEDDVSNNQETNIGSENSVISDYNNRGTNKLTTNLVYIPETVDGEYYDSSLINQISQMELTSLQPKKLWNYSSFLKPFSDKNKERHLFTISSVFKWGYRKGWDVLLEAYWRAFLDFEMPESLASCVRLEDWDPSQEVGLKLRTSKPEIGATKLVFESRAGGSSASEGIPGEVRAYARHFISSYLPKNEKKPLRPLQWLIHLPSVEVFDVPLSRAALRYFVGHSDLFALPSRGEGWGLPITEAMALGVPVTSTYHAGPMLYLTTNNSFPLSPSRINEDDGTAEPPVMELRDIIRRRYIEWKLMHCDPVVNDNNNKEVSNNENFGLDELKREDGYREGHGETFERTKQARDDVIHKFSPLAVATLMYQRLLAHVHGE